MRYIKKYEKIKNPNALKDFFEKFQIFEKGVYVAMASKTLADASVDPSRSFLLSIQSWKSIIKLYII